MEERMLPFNKFEEDLVEICGFLTKLGVKLEIYDTSTKHFDPPPLN